MKQWVMGVAGIALLAVLCDVVLPDGKTKKFVKTAIGIVVTYVVVSPLLKLAPQNVWWQSEQVQPQQQYLQYVASRYEEQTEKLRDCLEKSGFHSPDVNYDVSKGAAVVRFKESKSDELYILARQAVAESKCSFLVYMEWSG